MKNTAKDKATARMIESKDTWFGTDDFNVFIRTSEGWVYKKEVNDAYYGGFKTLRVGENTLLGKEWLRSAGC